MKRSSLFCCFLLVLALLPLPLGAQGSKLKVYISVDMEGICGVVTGQQTGTSGFEYQRFREFMTAEVNATIEAALEAGASEIVVSDSHGNAQNILIEKLNPAARLVRSWPRPLLMMQGIDPSFDSAMFIGYHAAEVKRAYGITSALTMAPERAQQLIRERTRAALARLQDFRPYRLSSPVTMELTLKRMRDAELLAMLPTVERPQANVIRVRFKDMVEATKFLGVAISID